MSKIWKIAVVALALAGGLPALAQDPGKGAPATVAAPPPEGRVADLGVSDDDYALGNPDATVVLVEYASLTCPHCASFHTDILPALRKNYIDTGKVRYVYRDFPLDRTALVAALVARCGGRDRFFGFIEALYGSQARWTAASDPVAALRTVALLGGVSGKEIDGCLRDQKAADEVLKGRLTANRQFGVTGTPTLFVNGFRYAAGYSVAQYSAILESLLAKP